MKIGIDISQLVYRNTGVANYLKAFVRELTLFDTQNTYILFYSSMRGKILATDIPQSKNIRIVKSFLPPTLLDLLWNKLHLLPIEVFIGDIDIFITSDWVEPPVKRAKKATILYDLVVYKYPEESTKKIVQTQKRKLMWVKKESEAIFCISQATKEDAIEVLKIPSEKLHVIYPGFTL
ncbi:hypothetical protein BH09PAT1_BH09PAT1_4740 [soil metagenome]